MLKLVIELGHFLFEFNDIGRTQDPFTQHCRAVLKQAHKYFKTLIPFQVALAGQLMLIFHLVSFYLGPLIPNHLILIQFLVS